MKMKKRIVTVMMALIVMISLVACGGGGKNPVGMYALSKMGDSSMEMTVEEMAAIFETEISVTLELTKDNKFTWDMGFLADEEGEVYSGTWKMDGDSLILNVEGEEVAGTYDGKSITIDMEDMVFTFEKQ